MSAVLPSVVSESRWAALSAHVAAHLGLHFPRNRYRELRRGMEKAAAEYGFDDLDACIQWLLAQPPTQARLVVLARHLTIGETYFFRDLQALEVLSSEVLAPLVASRGQAGRYLRLWSAGCSSGEEAYTLAILLHRMVPDIARWNITILATDINTQSLRKAESATYGEWSFRSAPAWLKPGYFSRGDDGRYTVLPHIRRMVRFGYLNLADPLGTASGLDVQGMDVILCRHVLMYFEDAQAPLAVGRLHASLLRDGWLVTSSCEATPQRFPGFDAVTHAGAVLMRRRDGGATLQGGLAALEAGRYVMPPARAGEAAAAFLPPLVPPLVPPSATAVAARPLPARRQAGAHPASPVSPASPARMAAAPARTPSAHGAGAATTAMPAAADQDAAAFSDHVHALAARGRLEEALHSCDRRLAANKLDAASHYLRAMVLLEMGRRDHAEDALSKALYVDPNDALVHFAKGQLALTRQARTVARRHFRQAHGLLLQRPGEELLAHSDGMSVGALRQALAVLLADDGDAA